MKPHSWIARKGIIEQENFNILFVKEIHYGHKKHMNLGKYDVSDYFGSIPKVFALQNLKKYLHFLLHGPGQATVIDSGELQSAFFSMHSLAYSTPFDPQTGL